MNLRERAEKNIIDRRKSIGLSQEGLAKQAGLSRAYVGKIENARFSVTIDTIEKVAHALGVETVDLFAPRSLNAVVMASSATFLEPGRLTGRTWCNLDFCRRRRHICFDQRMQTDSYLYRI